MSLTYGSVCSGIESASVAWEPLGFAPLWFSEIEPFPSAVLAHHWPKVPNLGDMAKLKDLIKFGLVPAPDVLVGGTPCQAFSVAGKRASLADDRGQLTLEYVRLLNEIDNRRKQPAVCVWENVPGVLNTKDNAFGCFLGELAGAGVELQPPNGKRWGGAGLINGPRRNIAWRVIDAQYFGVAQRRRRVFVVASARDGFDPGQVLFEFEGVRRDTPPSRTPQTRTTGATESGSHWDGAVIPIADRATRYAGKTGTGSGNGLGVGSPSDPSFTLTRGDKHAVNQGASVRKLTPVEAERLQGFEDNYTRVPYRGKPAEDCPDGPRYQAIGNSKAVPCIRWVGVRLLDHLSKLGDTGAN